MNEDDILQAIFRRPAGEEQRSVSDKEQQYTQIFGPYVKGEYSIGDVITYYDAGESVTGVVVWSFVNDNLHTYAIDPGHGLPVEVEAHELAQTNE